MSTTKKYDVLIRKFLCLGLSAVSFAALNFSKSATEAA
jgi:hypothetical protein